jgi:hypothetical protein
MCYSGAFKARVPSYQAGFSKPSEQFDSVILKSFVRILITVRTAAWNAGKIVRGKGTKLAQNLRFASSNHLKTKWKPYRTEKCNYKTYFHPIPFSLKALAFELSPAHKNSHKDYSLCLRLRKMLFQALNSQEPGWFLWISQPRLLFVGLLCKISAFFVTLLQVEFSWN